MYVHWKRSPDPNEHAAGDDVRGRSLYPARTLGLSTDSDLAFNQDYRWENLDVCQA